MTLNRLQAGDGMTDKTYGTAETIYGEIVERQANSTAIEQAKIGTTRFASGKVYTPVGICIGDLITDDTTEWTVTSRLKNPRRPVELIELERPI